MATALGRREAEHVLASGAELVATGNIGCMTQLRSRLAALGGSVPVLHTVQVLDRAVRGELASG